jgi:hypothetical protein
MNCTHTSIEKQFQDICNLFHYFIFIFLSYYLIYSLLRQFLFFKIRKIYILKISWYSFEFKSTIFLLMLCSIIVLMHILAHFHNSPSYLFPFPFLQNLIQCLRMLIRSCTSELHTQPEYIFTLHFYISDYFPHPEYHSVDF